jgi:hypothetical protein
MKTLLASVLSLVSSIVMAQPGSHALTCKSAKHSGSHQIIEISLRRSNSVGFAAPSILMKVDGATYKLESPDDMKSYGDTFHNSPLGVIQISANNYDEENAAVRGSYSVVGIPSTVRAFDEEGNPVKWSLKKDLDFCFDSNGKAVFKGVLHGDIYVNEKLISIEPQILDCELIYNSGSAC